MTVSENPKVLVHMNPQFGKCPQCKSVGTLHRSRAKSMFEQIVRRITFFKTYRCKECGWRGFRSTLIFTRKSVRHIIIYTIIIIITALLARYLILNFALT
ncbi:MAG: hypothetical protein WC879_07400 [Melioribacteraceae bacterium]